MSQPAIKIWCPKCHKRHRLPANAGGMTLRCRGCQFAFRVQDGLMQDPGGEVVLLGEADIVSPAGPKVVSSGPADNVSPEGFPAETEPSNVSESKAKRKKKRKPEPEPKPIALDHDFDDILDVLEAPVSEPMAPPPRAHSKGEHVPYAGGVVEATGTQVPPTQTETQTQTQTATVQRQPVSRSQLRAHRNSRQFWMLMSLLSACLLGTVSWVAVNLFLKPDLSVWERKLLYAMGTPARWLPPQEDGGEVLLPPDHVKLRGDHIKLADRDDKFRDDFFVLPPEKDDGDRKEREFARNDRNPPADADDRLRQAEPRRPQMDRRDRDVVPPRNQRQNDNQANNGGRPKKLQAPIGLDPGENRNQAANNGARANKRQGPVGFDPGLADGPPGRGGANRRGAANRNRAATRRPNNNRVAANRGGANRSVAWNPPEISDAEMQVALSRGIDPKTIQTLSVETDEKINVALVGETVFSIAAGNRLTALDIRFNESLDSRKLDRKVAAICAAAPDGVSNRPAAWVLYDSGQLEKWEVLNRELNRTTSIRLKPVFKEKRPVVVSGSKAVATGVGDQVFIATIFEAAARVGSTVSVPVGGSVSSLRFSQDSSQLMAVANGQAFLINVADGAVVSKTQITDLPQTGTQSISEDLSSLFFARNGSVDSIRLSDGAANGRYWSSVPRALTAVVSNEENLLALSAGSPSHAVLFSVTDMVSDTAPGKVANNGGDESSLLQDDAANAGARQVHELSRSPKFAGKVLAVQALAGNRVAFLSDENGRRRIGVATWGESWSVAPLTLAAGMNINGFHMSDDLSKVAIFDADVIQTWSIKDVESGMAEFVSEAVSHTEEISRVMLSKNGAYVVSGDSKGNVNVSNFETGLRTGSVSGFSTRILDMVAKGDEGFVVMDQRGLALGSSKTNRDKITPFGTTVSGAAALSSIGNRIAYQSGADVRVADINSQKIIGTLEPGNRPHSLEFSQNQKYLLLQDASEISVWDWRKGERVRVFRLDNPGNRFVRGSVALSVSTDGQTIAAAVGDNLNQISIFEMPKSE